MRIGFLIAGVALAAAIILALNYYLGESEPQSESLEAVEHPIVPEAEAVPEPLPEMPIDETASQPVGSQPEAVPTLLPPLSESDELVREALSGSLLPDDWVSQEDLLRRLAVLVENGARGEYPRRQLDFLAPQGKFKIREQGQILFIDPQNFQRYDGFLDILESIPTESLAGLLNDTTPLLEEALAELGSTESPSAQLLAAIDQVLAVPVIRGDIELIQPKVFYEYADPALEGLSALQKQALRLGPDNLTRLKNYLMELRLRLRR
jgi:hypothetical protein